MTRTHSSWVSADTKQHLDALLEAARAQAVHDYRNSMRALGADLAHELQRHLPSNGTILFVVTVEDADFLCRGVLDALQLGARAVLSCYWNERDRDRNTAPVVSRYEEPIGSNLSAIVVMKSVVSGACVVRTNLMEAMDRVRQSVPVFVVAPVMHTDAEQKLREEFSEAVSKRMHIITCAVDSEKDGDLIRPGVGGSVYELLGFTDGRAKNRHRPSLVAERTKVVVSPTFA
jgi:hypothetical protein